MTYSVAEAPPFTDNVLWYGSANSLGGFLGEGMLLPSGPPVSTAWPTTNKAIYVPFVLQSSQTLYRVGWHNGATPGGTCEVGVYSAGGTKVISGAATGSGASVAQFVDVTDTLLGPGQYWIAATDTTTGTWMALTNTAPVCAALGILTQVTANPLPSTATFALDNVLAFIPTAFLQMRSTM